MWWDCLKRKALQIHEALGAHQCFHRGRSLACSKADVCIVDLVVHIQPSSFLRKAGLSLCKVKEEREYNNLHHLVAVN